MDIQSLIDDIDGILLMAASRPLWFKPGDPVRERQVLERVRSYLVSQQQIAARQPNSAMTTSTREAAQQIVQAVSQEMAVLRNNLIQPLQADLTVLRQQRESLVEEIHQMKQSKQELVSTGVSPQFISEFSQELVSQCTMSLTKQFGYILEDLETRWSGIIVGAATPVSTTSKDKKDFTPKERLEQLRQLQAESDHLLLTLDANQRVIFEAIQSNLQSYQESLSQGLEKMHNLGAQGETLFTALINRLAQQLGRDASTLLQSSLPASENQTALEPATPNKVITPLTQLPPQPQIPQPLTEDNLAEPLHSEDWEIIEGLDSDNSDDAQDDRLDTFLQLDLDPANPATPEDLDYLLGLVNEPASPSPSSQAGEVTGLEALAQAAELNVISDQRRQEIDDLYKSLFGGDSVLTTNNETLNQSSDQNTPATAASEPINLEQTNAEVGLPVEELLFEGLVDPAIQATQGQTENWLTRTSNDSWDLFVETSPLSPVETGTPPLAPSETTIEQETITTIASLTDLFEDMGLSRPQVRTDETPVLSQPAVAPSQTEAQAANLVDELYIAASPDEDLLATPEDVAPEPQIELDQNVLQQLSNDLENFEDAPSRKSFQPEATVAPAIERTNRFLMSDELLAEDWEEFVFPSWPDDDLTSNLSQETVLPTPTENQPSLAEALDFEPDLFPSDAIEFDQESVNNAADQHLPEEYIAFEDEIVIDEIEWDDATDELTEAEAIPSPLEFGSPGKQSALLIGQENEPNNFTMPVSDEPSINDSVTPESLQEAENEEIQTLPQKLLAPSENALDSPIDSSQPDASSQANSETPHQTDQVSNSSSEEMNLPPQNEP